MDNKKFKKSSCFFECSHCDYTTVRQSQYDRHMLTSKHKRITLDNETDNDLVQNHFQCQCDNLLLLIIIFQVCYQIKC